MSDGFRTIVYAGSSRIFADAADVALEMVDAINASNHSVCAVIAKSGDPILDAASSRNFIPIPLHASLYGSPSVIRKAISQPNPDYTNWLETLNQLVPDCGVSFYAGWIPKELRQLPKFQFLNIHPSPLPLFAGYEVERFHVLKDYRNTCGTIHYLDDNFDCGTIVARGNNVVLPEDITPMDVYEIVLRACFSPLIDIIDKLAHNFPIVGKPQTSELIMPATHKNAQIESVINWTSDTHRQIDCRLRAFNTIPNAMVLKAQIDDKLWSVPDLITNDGDYKSYGDIGKQIGNYKGNGTFTNAPVIRTTEGIAILRLGVICQSCNEEVSLKPNETIPRRRPRHKLTDDERKMIVFDCS
jgi:methionyl-tRNA formyltransferase